MSEHSASENYASAPEDSYSSEGSRNLIDEEFEKVMGRYSNPDFSFYKEFCRLFLSNLQLQAQVPPPLTQIK